MGIAGRRDNAPGGQCDRSQAAVVNMPRCGVQAGLPHLTVVLCRAVVVACPRPGDGGQLLRASP